MSCPPESGAGLLTQPLESPAAWRGDALATDPGWRIRLEHAHVAELLAALSTVRSARLDLAAITPERFTLPSFDPVIRSLRQRLEGGHGFVLVQGLPFHRLPVADCRALFWGFGRHLGEPEPQDAAGNLLHDVRDTGTRFGTTRTVRYYQTDQEITFHNDGADCFALACRATAARGGRSRIVSAVEVFNEVARRRPELAQVLQQDFWQDTRGQGRDGAMFQVMPIYFHHHGLLSANYKHQLILSAQAFDEVPKMTVGQHEALGLLDAVCNEPGMALEFDLEPGDVLIANNYVTFHSRTAFEDHPDPERKRHMLRLWLTLPNGRPLPAIFAATREFGCTYERRIGRR